MFQAVLTMSDDDLVELLRLRPDLATPRPTSVHQAATRADSWPSLERCLGRLDAAAHQVLHVSCLLPEPCSLEAVATLVGPVRPDALAPVLGRLRRLGLLAGPDDGLRVTSGVRSRLTYPASLGRPAAELLTLRSKADLAAVARARSVPASGSKHTLVGRLTARLADPEALRRLLDDAPDEVLELLEQLGDHPVCHLGIEPRWGRSAGSTPSRWLLERGLLVQTGFSTAEMPREVGLARRGGVAFADVQLGLPSVGGEALAPEEVARSAGAAADATLWAVAALGRVLGDGPASLLKAGGVGVREVKRLARDADLAADDVPRLLELAHAAGLIAVGDGWVAPTPAFDQWSTEPPAEQWLALVDGWRGVPREPGLAGRRDDDDKMIPALDLGTAEPEAPARRDAFLAALAATAPHVAANPGDVRFAAVWQAPMSWPQSVPVQVTVIGWLREEAELLGLTGRGALSGPARALLDGDRDGARRGAAAMLSAPEASFTLQGDLTAVTAANLDPRVRHELALLATVESSGGATVWRFGEASIARAFDAGRSADEVLAFLETHATRGVPQPLAYLVTDAARRHGSLRVAGVGSYVRSEDPTLVAQVLRMRRAGTLGLRQLAPTVVVASAPPDELLAALRAGGFLPVTEGVDGALLVSRQPAVRTTAEANRPGRRQPLDDAARRALVADLRAAPSEPTVPTAVPRPAEPAGHGRRGAEALPNLFGNPRYDGELILPGLEEELFDDDIQLGDDGFFGEEVDFDDELLDLLTATNGPVSITYRDRRGIQTVTGMVLAVDAYTVAVLPFGGKRVREVPLDAVEVVEPLVRDARRAGAGGRR